MVRRPAPTEYAPYYETYVRLVEDADIAELLARQIDETVTFYREMTEARANHRYAAGKWSAKELLGHVSDTERVFQFRAFCFARGDAGPLPGFEQDDYARVAGAGSRPWTGLIDELKTVRAASVSLFRSLDDAALERRGVANNNPVTVRALGYIIAGHERHHLAVLKERYLPVGN